MTAARANLRAVAGGEARYEGEATRLDRVEDAHSGKSAAGWQARPLTTIATTAMLTGLSKSGIRDLLNRGELVGVRCNRRRLVRTDSIVAWIERHTEVVR